jgi:hypothetical protein
LQYADEQIRGIILQYTVERDQLEELTILIRNNQYFLIELVHA